jgi:hypothetical protein
VTNLQRLLRKTPTNCGNFRSAALDNAWSRDPDRQHRFQSRHQHVQRRYAKTGAIYALAPSIAPAVGSALGGRVAPLRFHPLLVRNANYSDNLPARMRTSSLIPRPLDKGPAGVLQTAPFPRIAGWYE